MSLILASSSPYRRALLERLQLPFECSAPAVDESPRPGEDASSLVRRLALAKAGCISSAHPDKLVIGSDQAASLSGAIVGKPGSRARAVEQLQASSGKKVRFFTAVALVRGEPALQRVHVELFTVRFRQLTRSAIEDYLDREQPYDCAGSFKCEGLGIALFESLEGTDPTSLEGLPLIALTSMLLEAGHPVLNS